jgi:hypothetical protein
MLILTILIHATFAQAAVGNALTLQLTAVAADGNLHDTPAGQI